MWIIADSALLLKQCQVDWEKLWASFFLKESKHMQIKVFPKLDVRIKDAAAKDSFPLAKLPLSPDYPTNWCKIRGLLSMGVKRCKIRG